MKSESALVITNKSIGNKANNAYFVLGTTDIKEARKSLDDLSEVINRKKILMLILLYIVIMKSSSRSLMDLMRMLIL